MWTRSSLLACSYQVTTCESTCSTFFALFAGGRLYHPAVYFAYPLAQNARQPAQVSDRRADRETASENRGQRDYSSDHPSAPQGALASGDILLLWQGGMRLSEVEELRLEDLDMSGRQLTVRRGKGQFDRAVFLTDTVVASLKAYLAVHGPEPADHVFLYRNQALCKDLIHGRL